MALTQGDRSTVSNNLTTIIGAGLLTGMVLAITLFGRLHGLPSLPSGFGDGAESIDLRPDSTLQVAAPEPTVAPAILQPIAADRSAEPLAQSVAPPVRERTTARHPARYFVLSASEISARIDHLALQAGIELSDKRGVRIHNNKVTMFAEQIGERRAHYHEIVFAVSAENGQTRITLERAVTNGHKMSEPLQTQLLHRLATEVDALLAHRIGDAQLSAISYSEGEIIFEMQ